MGGAGYSGVRKSALGCLPHSLHQPQCQQHQARPPSSLPFFPPKLIGRKVEQGTKTAQQPEAGSEHSVGKGRSFEMGKRLYIYIFFILSFFFGRAAQLVGSYVPSQGSNPCAL